MARLNNIPPHFRAIGWRFFFFFLQAGENGRRRPEGKGSAVLSTSCFNKFHSFPNLQTLCLERVGAAVLILISTNLSRYTTAVTKDGQLAASMSSCWLSKSSASVLGVYHLIGNQHNRFILQPSAVRVFNMQDINVFGQVCNPVVLNSKCSTLEIMRRFVGVTCFNRNIFILFFKDNFCFMLVAAWVLYFFQSFVLPPPS